MTIPITDSAAELGLPVFDIGAWSRASGEDSVRLARDAVRMCQRHAFLYLIGHGIPQPILDGAFAMARSYFALPLAEKERINYGQTGGNSGYIPSMAEKTDRTTKGDAKEGFATGLRIPDVDPALLIAKKVTTPNLWPDNPPGFRPIVEGMLEAMRGVAAQVLAVAAEGLGGSRSFFADKVDRPLATLRLYRYPSQDPADDVSVGIGRHTDMECMSLLAQDDVGGLEVVSPGGGWRAATPLPGTLVLIVGEQLARWTNGMLKPTPHRVINRAGRERYSMPFFFTTNVDAPVGVIDGILPPGEAPRYEPVLAGEYVMQRLHQVYAEKPAA